MNTRTAFSALLAIGLVPSFTAAASRPNASLSQLASTAGAEKAEDVQAPTSMISCKDFAPAQLVAYKAILHGLRQCASSNSFYYDKGCLDRQTPKVSQILDDGLGEDNPAHEALRIMREGCPAISEYYYDAACINPVLDSAEKTLMDGIVDTSGPRRLSCRSLRQDAKLSRLAADPLPDLALEMEYTDGRGKISAKGTSMEIRDQLIKDIGIICSSKNVALKPGEAAPSAAAAFSIGNESDKDGRHAIQFDCLH